VQAGNSYVTNQFGPLAHDLGGDFRLGCDGQIRRAGGDYRQNGPGDRHVFLLKDYCPGKFVVTGLWEFICFGQSFECIWFGPGRQDIVAPGGKTLEYLDYMLDGLAGAEDDFRKTPPDLTMVVNACKAQIFERQVPELLNGLVDSQLVVLDLLQQFFYLFSLNISPFNYELLAFGSSVKSAKSPALNL
jgi:hypothetical protein